MIEIDDQGFIEPVEIAEKSKNTTEAREDRSESNVENEFLSEQRGLLGWLIGCCMKKDVTTEQISIDRIDMMQ